MKMCCSKSPEKLLGCWYTRKLAKAKMQPVYPSTWTLKIQLKNWILQPNSGVNLLFVWAVPGGDIGAIKPFTRAAKKETLDPHLPGATFPPGARSPGRPQSQTLMMESCDSNPSSPRGCRPAQSLGSCQRHRPLKPSKKGIHKPESWGKPFWGWTVEGPGTHLITYLRCGLRKTTGAYENVRSNSPTFFPQWQVLNRMEKESISYQNLPLEGWNLHPCLD